MNHLIEPGIINNDILHMGMHAHAGGLYRQITVLSDRKIPVSLQGQGLRQTAAGQRVDIAGQLPGPGFIPVEDMDFCSPALCQHIGCCLGRASGSHEQTVFSFYSDTSFCKSPAKACAVRIIAFIPFICPDQGIDCPDGPGILIQFRQKIHNTLFMGNRYVHPQYIKGIGSLYRVPYLVFLHLERNVG